MPCGMIRHVLRHDIFMWNGGGILIRFFIFFAWDTEFFRMEYNVFMYGELNFPYEMLHFSMCSTIFPACNAVFSVCNQIFFHVCHGVQLGINSVHILIVQHADI